MTIRKTDKNPLPSYPVLESHLRSLKLPAMLQEYSQVARRCSSENASYETYLQEATSIEVLRRESNAIARRIRSARKYQR